MSLITKQTNKQTLLLKAAAISFFILFPTISHADITTGLVGWWRFDEATSGTCSGASILDSSGNSNTGTCNNSPTWTTGHLAGAMSFNGTNQNISMNGNNLPSTTSSRTISVWEKTTSSFLSGSHYRNILYYGTYNTNQAIFLSISTEQSTGAINNFYISQYGDRVFASSGNTVNDGNWHQLCATYDGTTWRLYIDGTASSTAGGSNHPNMTTNTLLTNSATIGEDPGGDYFPGTLDDMRIYNRALSSSDVAQLYRVHIITLHKAHLANFHVGN